MRPGLPWVFTDFGYWCPECLCAEAGSASPACAACGVVLRQCRHAPDLGRCRGALGVDRGFSRSIRLGALRTGGLWLAGYGVMRLSSAIRASDAISADATTATTVTAVLTTAAMLTFGNPHVYLDTVVLIGAVSLQFHDTAKLAYGAGAITASFVFFFMLGFGASLLAPTMQRPNAWRILDTLIALVMFLLALGMAKAGGWLGG